MKFRPALISSLVLLALFLCFFRLGYWQASRAVEKEAIILSAETAGAISSTEINQDSPRFSQVTLNGRFDPERHILLDNQILNGRPGVHVYTPFYFNNDGQMLLVNRGWLPMSVDRRTLPEIPELTDTASIQGRLNLPPTVGKRIGGLSPLHANQWPQLVTYLDLPQIREIIHELDPQWVVQLHPQSPAGFEGRDWKTVSMTPERHRGYSLQWYALALTAAVIWLILGLRRGKEYK